MSVTKVDDKLKRKPVNCLIPAALAFCKSTNTFPNVNVLVRDSEHI